MVPCLNLDLFISQMKVEEAKELADALSKKEEEIETIRKEVSLVYSGL